MPPPKPFKPVATPDLAYKEGIKGPARPLAAPTSPSVTAPMPTATSAAVTVPVPSPLAKPVNRKNQLKDKWGKITGRVLEYLDGDDEKTGKPRLELLLADTKLKDIAIFAGIGTEKVLLLEGQPTQIIGQPQQQKLDQLGQALQTMMQQRGLGKTVTLTERTAKIELEQPK